MAIQKFNGRAGFSIGHPPVDLIDNTGNYDTTTGSITAVNGTFTGDVSAVHFNGDFIGELQVDCKNTSGSIIAAGVPVYITGTVGATSVLEVSPANASSSSTMPAIGLTTSSIAVGATGHVTIMGVVQNVNTNSYTAGQTLYVAVGGGLTNVKPTGATDLIQNIGRVGRSNTNNGEIIVTGPGRTNDVPNKITVNDTIVFSNGSIQDRAPQGNRTPGYISTVNVVSSAGVTSSNQINYYGPEFVRTGSANGHVVVANRIYFNTIYLSRQTTIRRIRCQSGNTVTTGNVIFGIYSNNNTTGFPLNKLYESASIAVGSGYTVNVVNNDTGLITLQPGFYHLCAVFSSTPIIFGYNNGNCNYAHYGSIEHGGGYQNIVPWIDYGSFALPTTTNGSTFYFHHQGITSNTSPLRLDFGVIA